nr:fused MFS/spermidine synthase [uncultured Fluviicola sp.]
MNTTKRFLSYLFPVTIEKRTGSYLPIIEVNLRNGKYILDGDSVNYSFGSLHDLFLQTLTQFKIKERPIKNVLILGFGAGSIAQILRKEFQMNCFITGVEVDSVMLELANKYFNLSNYKNIEIVCEDADEFIHQDNNMYDLIIVDLFVERRVPKKFMKSEFLYEIKYHLSPNGFLFFNRLNENAFQQEETKNLINTMNTVMNGTTQMVNFHQNEIDNVILVHQNRFSREKEENFIKEMEFSIF